MIVEDFKDTYKSGRFFDGFISFSCSHSYFHRVLLHNCNIRLHDIFSDEN